MKKYEILVAIYKYLEFQYNLNKYRTEEYIYYLSNIDPFIWNDEGTADPAYYEEFTELYNKYFEVNECSIKEGYEFAQKYLDEHNKIEHEQYGSNIDEVINVFAKCSLEDWEKIVIKI